MSVINIYFSKIYIFFLISLLCFDFSKETFQKLGFFCVSSPEQLFSIVRASVIFFFYFLIGNWNWKAMFSVSWLLYYSCLLK